MRGGREGRGGMGREGRKAYLSTAHVGPSSLSIFGPGAIGRSVMVSGGEYNGWK